MTAAVAVGLLAASGTYLVLQRERLRVVIGFVLLGHAVNVLFVAAGGMGDRGAPLLGGSDPDAATDPLPQAFVLTAVVITFGITVYLLAMLRDDLTGPTDDASSDAPAGPTAPNGRDQPDGSGQPDGSDGPADGRGAADRRNPGHGGDTTGRRGPTGGDGGALRAPDRSPTPARVTGGSRPVGGARAEGDR